MRAPSWRPTFAEISLANLKHNCEKLRNLFQPGSFFCPMVKANAYGHGAVEIAKTLEKIGVTHLGVALTEEGEQLRRAGVKTDILVFAPIESYAAAQALQNSSLTPVISDFESLEFFEKTAPTQAKLHLEFNTGMNRFGFETSDVEKLENFFKTHAGWWLEGLCTHFQNGGDIADPNARSHAQLKSFEAIVKRLQTPKTAVHVLNSSAALALKDHGVWGFRPGISLYSADPASANLDLRPVLEWQTQVSVVHHLKAGESVSYNATWTALRPSVIGVLPVGYADGYQRANSNKSHVLCRGLQAPVVGTICMDALMIDLTEIERQTGPILHREPIVLIGEQAGTKLTASDLAFFTQTISYEVLTRIGERVPRVYNDVT